MIGSVNFCGIGCNCVKASDLRRLVQGILIAFWYYNALEMFVAWVDSTARRDQKHP